jgi:hypothetical protein
MKKIICLLSVVFVLSSCTKVMIHAQEQKTDTVTKAYAVSCFDAFAGLQETLKLQGYKLLDVDLYNFKITTGWQSVKSDSHYMELFKRADYAASSGAYYKIEAVVEPDGTNSRVAITTVVKSVAGPLKSSRVIEKKVFSKLSDQLRGGNIDVTNVGMAEK